MSGPPPETTQDRTQTHQNFSQLNNFKAALTLASRRALLECMVMKQKKCGAFRLILQPFRHFTYVKAHSPTLPSLYLRHSSFSNPFLPLPTPQFILQPFFHFSYVTSSSLNSPEQSSFSKLSVTSSMSQLILQPFRRFT